MLNGIKYYTPSSLFQFQKWIVTRNQKKTKTATVKTILEIFSAFYLDFSKHLSVFSAFC